MLRSTVNAFERFGEITDQLEQAAVVAIDAGARTAAEVAQANASIELELETIPAHGDLDGYAGGIKSRRQTSTKGKTTPIALFFDKGTLGNRKAKLSPKTRRRQSWQVTRGGTTYTAHRHGISPGEGIEPENFFLKARIAGRKALLARLDRTP